jgi:hypothetical protein
MSVVVSKANILEEASSLLEDVLIFDDDVVTSFWVRYHKLCVLLARLVLNIVADFG